MTRQSFINKIKSYFLKILYLQLFLTIISLPILIIWGLPLSLLSPIGNIIFSPVLTIFLFMSSLIFFFELFCIPNDWLVKGLDILTTEWLKALNYGSKKVLLTFEHMSNVVLILFVLAAIIIIHLKNNNLKRKIFLLFIILISFCIFSKLNQTKNIYEEVSIESKNFSIILKNNKINIIDDRENLSKSIISDSFLEYNLLPFLIKKYGHCDIDNIILQCNERSFQTIKSLIKKTKIDHIYFIINKKIPETYEKISELKNVKIHFIKKINDAKLL